MISYPVPTRIDLIGDRQLCLEAIGYAKLQMSILENLMSFQELSQYSLTRVAPNGCVVECWSCFDLRQIVISARPIREPKKYEKEFCFCTSCVALGFITEVTNIVFSSTTAPCYNQVSPIPMRNVFYCGNIIYTVSVCSGIFYTIFENIKALDNSPFCISNKVLVTPIANSEDTEAIIQARCFSACGKSCFANPANAIINVGIMPINVDQLPKRYTLPDANSPQSK